jgi:hypothetical protein
MTQAEYEHACRMCDEGEVVQVIEVSDEEVAAITAKELLSAIATHDPAG